MAPRRPVLGFPVAVLAGSLAGILVGDPLAALIDDTTVQGIAQVGLDDLIFAALALTVAGTLLGALPFMGLRALAMGAGWTGPLGAAGLGVATALVVWLLVAALVTGLSGYVVLGAVPSMVLAVIFGGIVLGLVYRAMGGLAPAPSTSAPAAEGAGT